jgi:N-acetylmuramoyl-L-alanine amidase
MNEKLRITLDPGHGERGNPYPAAHGFFEGTQMHRLAGFMTEALQKYGFDVINTREKLSDDPPVDRRGGMAAKNNSVLFLSLHSNAAASSTDTTAIGSEVFLSVRGQQFKPLAENLLAAVCDVMNHPSRGVKKRTIENNPHTDWFGVIRSAVSGGCACAMLLEHGFHTNPRDAAFLTADSNLRKLAEAEAAVIAEYFGVKPQAPLTAADALTALRVSAGLLTLSDDQIEKYDLNKDGRITSADALLILRVAAGR